MEEKQIYVKENSKNQRIDNFLIKIFKHLPKNIIYKQIRTGKFRINKKKIQPKYKLKINDIIKIPLNLNFKKKKKKIFTKINWKKKIIFEDKYLLIINKPQGIAVHGGSGEKFGIIEIFRNIYFKIKYLELAHRIDKNTSGVLILVKKRKILCLLHKQFKKHKIIKKYLALVHGNWKKSTESVTNILIKKNKNQKITKKWSKTYFNIKQKFKFQTLLSVYPLTGRKHQIRKHLLYKGCPIIFDQQYGNFKLDKKLKEKKKKMLLHAESIFFKHPIKKKKMLILAPLNDNFKKYLNKF